MQWILAKEATWALAPVVPFGDSAKSPAVRKAKTLVVTTVEKALELKTPVPGPVSKAVAKTLVAVRIPVVKTLMVVTRVAKTLEVKTALT